MLSIKIDDSDFRHLEAKVKLLPTAIQDSRFLKQAGMALVSTAKQNINEGSPNGHTSYQILKPNTIKQKQRLGLSSAPLKRSGVLMQSIDSEVSGGLYLTSVDYAKYHQFGTKRMPTRPIFSVREDTMQSIQTALELTLVRLLK